MINTIKVSNFRSIESAAAKLGPFNVLIGANGAGKTTLISVIDVFNKLASGLNLDQAISHVAPLRREIFNLKNRSHQAEIEITFRTDQDNRYKFSFKIGEKITEHNYGLIIAEEILTKLDENNEYTIYHRHLDSIRAINPKSGNKNLEEIPLTIDEDKLVLSSYSDTEVKAIAGLMVNSKILWLDRFDNTPIGLNVISSNDTAQDLEHSVIRLYESNREQYNEAVSMIKKIIPDFLEPEIMDVTKTFQKGEEPSSTATESKKSLKIKNYLLFWKEGLFVQGVTKQSLSSGNRKVIELVFNLYNCKNYSILIGEEIENGLHYGRIDLLLEVLKYLSKKHKVQLLFTTHSPQILNHVNPNEVIYCSKDESGSHYTTLHDTEEYQKIKEELNTEPTARELFESGFFD